MKINQVEELVGITKKNIRFYEDKGLISPSRNLENGYRDYTLNDVDQLNKIKLLRKLDVSIETIRQLNEGTISVETCMEDHIRDLSHRQDKLDTMKKVCQIIADDTAKCSITASEQDADNNVSSYHSDITSLNAAKYLEDMQHLEEGGNIFMDVQKNDVKKNKLGPIIAAMVCLLFFAAILLLILSDKEVPLAVMLFFIVILGAMTIGIIIALKQRLHEIEGGEIDEARKY